MHTSMNIFTYSMALVKESLSNDFQYPMFYIDWILLINMCCYRFWICTVITSLYKIYIDIFSHCIIFIQMSTYSIFNYSLHQMLPDFTSKTYVIFSILLVQWAI